jgi:hypothetical protein
MHTWLRHWLFWVLLILFVLLSALAAVALSLRSIGEREYRQFISSLHAKGEIATIDEYIASLPPVDKKVQDEWRAAIALMPEQNELLKFDGKKWHDVFMGKAQILPAVLHEHESARPFAETLIELLLIHKPVVSVRGFAADHFSGGKIRDIQAYSKAFTFVPSLLHIRSFTHWLQCELYFHPDNNRALQALEAITQAPCALLIESMIAIASQSIRDETHAVLAYHKQLSLSVIVLWTSEPSSTLRLVGDGFVGEYALSNNGYVQALTAGGFDDYAVVLNNGYADVWWENLLTPINGLFYWSTLHHDVAISSGYSHAVTQRLRGHSTVIPPTDELIRKSWGYGVNAIPNLNESIISALDYEAKHRRTRLAVRLMNDLTVPLPADTNALIQQFPYAADYLRPPRDALHQVYERISDHRFRIVVDPSSPPIDFDDATRMKKRGDMLGKPAAKEPYVWGQYHVEIDLSQRPASGVR